jgi:uncharacterized protein with gpF-like domain
MFRFQFMREYFPKPVLPEVRAMGAKAPLDPAALKRWEDIWKSIEFDSTPELQKVVKAIEADALLKGAAQLATQMRFDAKTTFSLSNPRAVAFFRETGGSLKYIKDIQSTTADSLQRLITTSLDEGWSYNDTAKEIRKLFDGPITTQRAQLIATNEAAQAYEAGNRAFADSIVDDGIKMEKKWTTSHDDRVSDGCAENESNGWIPLDEEHTSGDQDPPRFPGCRCYEQYREERA